MNHPILLLAGCVGAVTASLAHGTEREDFHALSQRCAPMVSSQILAPIVKVESGFNPYAIGVVGGRLARQPANKAEAVATANALLEAGLRFSAGVGQVYKGNWASYGLTTDSVFDPCHNIRVSAAIYQSCYKRAIADIPNPEMARNAAYSCYNSNNFTTGFKPDGPGQLPYVQKVLNSAASLEKEIPPAIKPIEFIPNKTTGQVATAKAVPAPKAVPERVDFSPARSSPPTPAIAKASVADAPQAVTQTPGTVDTQQTNPASPYVYLPRSDDNANAASAMVY